MHCNTRKYTTPLLALAVLAAAAPSTTSPQSRSLDISINFFTYYDCQNPCVETGMCPAGQVGQGFSSSSDDDWIGWDSGIWKFLDGTHSLAPSMSNEHKSTGIDKSSAAWKKPGFQGKSSTMKAGGYGGDAKCNIFNHGKVKAVFYHW